MTPCFIVKLANLFIVDSGSVPNGSSASPDSRSNPPAPKSNACLEEMLSAVNDCAIFSDGTLRSSGAIAERTLGGLVGAAQHNGKRGTVASGPDPISGRYKVRLDGGGNGGKLLGLLPANLRLLGPEGLEPEPELEL